MKKVLAIYIVLFSFVWLLYDAMFIAFSRPVFFGGLGVSLAVTLVATGFIMKRIRVS